MKSRFLAVAAVTLFVSLPAWAADGKSVLDDIVRMHRAGVTESTILEWVAGNELEVNLSADDVVDLSKEGLTDSFIRELINLSPEPSGATAPPPVALYYPPSYYGSAYYDPWYYPSRFYVNVGHGAGYGHGYGYGRGGGHRAFPPPTPHHVWDDLTGAHRSRVRPSNSGHRTALRDSRDLGYGSRPGGRGPHLNNRRSGGSQSSRSPSGIGGGRSRGSHSGGARIGGNRSSGGSRGGGSHSGGRSHR